jgi:hypothetical protein
MTRPPGKYVGLALPQQENPRQVTDTTLLVPSSLAIAQRDRELAEHATARGAAHGGVGPNGGTAGSEAETAYKGTTAAGAAYTGEPEPSGLRNTRFFGVAKVSSALYMRDLTKIAQEVIRHLATSDDVDLQITLEISARNKDGYSDEKIRTVSENARTLKFDSYGFEDQ